MLVFVALLLTALYGPRLLAPADNATPSTPAVTVATSDEAAGGPDHGEETGGGHGGEMSKVLVALFVILLAAKLGGELLERVGQPAVLGELAVGMIIGNLTLVGYDGLAFLREEEVLIILAELGVILLLFEVGLESNIREMASVGVSSFLVACLGVIAPFFLGWGVARFFWPNLDTLVHVFIGAVLCATSVGITARVLKDMGKIRTRESRIILGAAVIDDVLGLIILAVCVGLIKAASGGGEPPDAMDILWIVSRSIAFFVGMVLAGLLLVQPIYRMASFLRVHGVLLTSALMICFLSAWVATKIELAPIVGAFAAGLILEDVHFKELPDRREHTLHELLAPLTTFLTPIFFVHMGIRVNLESFGQVSILGFAAALTIAAIVGKQICSLGVVERGLDRVAVGLGMIPRGEVGLIFAAEGAKLVLKGEKVVNDDVLSAVVIMVMITTMVTPPVLKWKFGRKKEVAQE